MSADIFLFNGRYRVLQPLGAGGMSQVYLAEQVSLQRKVAIKILKRDLRDDPTMAARFKREALLLSTVDHPSVVRVLEFEVEGEGAAVVLEYVEGPRLDALLSFSPLGLSRAFALLTQIAEGLAAIHRAGIVHRDLKPENVIITGSGFDERARVFDFGIARLFSVETLGGSDAQYISSIGQGVGTPSYVAPEQARGEAVGPPADVYAFGVTAFLLLAGRLPFTAADTHALIAQHLNEAPPKLSDVAPHVNAVPGLAEIVQRCLAKDPKQRFADGIELAAAMQALTVDQSKLSGIGPGAIAPTMREPKPVKRRTAFMPLLIGSLVIATAPCWALLEPWSPETQAQAVMRWKPQLALDLVQDSTTSRGLALKAQALSALGRTDEAAALRASAPHRANP